MKDPTLAENSSMPADKLYYSLFEKSPSCMYIFDKETLEILDVNEIMLKNYGYTREEFIGMNIKDLRPSEDVEKMKIAVKNLQEHYKAGAWRHKKKNGEIILIDVKAMNIDYNGRKAVLSIPEDVTEQEKNRKELERQVDNVQVILTSITDPFFILDNEYNFIFANAALSKLTGYELPDIEGKKLWPVFIHKNEDFTNLRRGLEKALKTKVSTELEFTYRKKTFRTHIYPSKIGLAVSCTDITSIKQAELGLKLNTKFVKEISESLPGIIFQTEYDKEMKPKFNYISSRVEEFTGYTAEEMMEDYSKHVSCIHKDDLHYFLQVRDNISNQKSVSIKYRYINHKTNELRWVRITLMPSKLSSGHLIRNGILLDVTETEKYYNELEKSNELYSYISKASFATIWDWDLTTNQIKWGGYYKEMLGEVYPGDICHTSEVKSKPHPEDLPLLQKKYAEIFASNSNNFWECSYRLIKADGNTVHLNERGYLTYDEKAGKHVRFVGSTQDITEKVKSQEALLEQSRKVNIIIESVSEPFFILNKDLEVLLVNDAALKISGKPREEMLGNHIRSIGARADHNSMFDMFEKSIAEQESLQMELNIRGRWFAIYSYPSEIGLAISAKDITSRKKEQEELKERNAFIGEISRSVPGALFQLAFLNDGSSKMNYISEGLEKLVGFTVGEVQQDPEKRMMPMHPDDVQKVIDARTESLKNLTMMNVKFRFVNQKTGEINWVKLLGYPSKMPDGSYILNGVIVDINEEQKFYSEMEKSNQRYENISRASNETIWDMDVKTSIVTLGGAYREMYGTSFPNNQVDGYEAEKFIHPDDLPKMLNQMAEVVSKREHYLEERYRLCRPDGSIIYVYERGYIFYEEGTKNPIRILGTMQDVTALRLAEIEKEKVIEDLVKRNRALEQFTYMVSHNIRAPIANIMGLSEMLEDDAVDIGTKAELSGMIKASSARLDEVVRDINEILSIAKDVHEEKCEVKFETILNEVKSMEKQTLKKSGIKITSDFKEAQSIFAVKSYLVSIFQHLISNSIKFKKEKSAQIKITSKRDKEFVYLTFEDNGIGFDAVKNKDKVFGLYNRFHLEKDGKGMGLFIVSKHVENLGGEICVESEIDKGTKFLIKLKDAAYD